MTGMVAQDLVVAWEDAYRRYENAVGNDVTETSRAVAGAWHELATCADLPWWLSAAVRSAAEAFEHQAADWTADGAGHDDMAAVHTDDEDEEEEEDDDGHVGFRRVVVPTQQGNQKSCACVDAPPFTGHAATAIPVVRITA
jgi:hypothetical protein